MDKGARAADMLNKMARDLMAYDRRTLRQEGKKKLARLKVQYAVRAGKVERPTACTRCRVEGPTEAHHLDYSKPLEVEHLCRKCHKLEHKKETN